MNKLQRIELRAFKAGMRHAARLGRTYLGRPSLFTRSELDGVDAMRRLIEREASQLKAVPSRYR